MRFFLDSDADGHWYVVPENKRAEWQAWVNCDDEDSWQVPDYAKAVGGAPSLVTFTDPQ